ncbi:SDR family NAD(P)-dependent oxidoreductase [Spectribacter hydrogenooxidans]|uniref:SDR family NAD(P)-dependent oxidoreductase n=1 Tax=Spectribacter hydrogenoxidans TaxID=3075608 RepID=A0ABU3BWQ1_9GAMM|nr:SDR family NAD(P)-dependent oxidoreductase [Salinisphaera sp. W335]MDT0633729.1 SDR family NAD(P)-dependent oxidoreductase [Salinisphaera sp. W335]
MMALDQLPDNAQVLVQGAARGLGRALAEQLLRESRVATLIATSRDADSPGLAELARTGGKRVLPLALDITGEAGIRQAMGRVAEQVPALDLVIVCAGLLHDRNIGMHPEKRLADITPERLAAGFAVNAFGPILLLKHAQLLLNHGRRAVFASLSARVGSIADNHLGGWYTYRAAKAAQNQFTRTAAIEMRRRNRESIVVGLHPGTTDTDLSRPFQRNVPDHKLFTPAFAATRLLEVINNLTPEDSGGLFAWDGERIPY